MARYYIEQCVTLYHMEVFEADDLEDARRMRDHLTYEWNEHLDEAFVGRTVTTKDMQTCDYVDMGKMDWDWDGPVMSKEEFISKYTSLEG